MSYLRLLAAGLATQLLCLSGAYAADRNQEFLNGVIRGARTDAERAEKILKAAGTVADEADLRTYLLEKCYEYGLRAVRSPSAYDCAEKALLLLAKEDPSRTETCRRKLRKLYEAGSRGGLPEVAFSASWKLAEMLVAEGDGAAKARQWPQALKLYQQAEATIRARKLGWDAPVRAKALHAIHRQRAEPTRKRLVESLTESSDDPAAREALILFHVTEVDDPAGAAELLTDKCPRFLRDYVPIAAKELGQREANACAELGNWYASLASSPKTSPVGKAVSLMHAKANYERFLRIYAKRDQTRIEATDAVARTRRYLRTVKPEMLGAAWLLRRNGLADTGAVSAAMQMAGEEGLSMPEDAREAVSRGAAYLLSKQDPSGEWLYTRRAHEKNPCPDRSTVLATCALLQSGVPAVHPVVARALNWLDGRKISDIEALSFRVNVWMLANRQLGGKYSRNLRADVKLLLGSAKKKNGHGSAIDTFFAIRGISCGASGKATVPPRYWALAQSWWVASQMQNGGWAGNWKNDREAKLGVSATVVGLSSLILCESHVRRCPPQALAARRAAIAWLNKYYDTDIFNYNYSGWWGRLFERLYFLAVAGTAAGERSIGDVDWYEHGKRVLLKRQHENGGWEHKGYDHRDSNMCTSYALLFLTQGRQTAGILDLGALSPSKPADETR